MQLVQLAIFGMAFGFVEAAVVIYLRAAAGPSRVPQAETSVYLPEDLLRIERFREAATMVVLGCIAVFVARQAKGRALAFLWAFAVWEVSYYLWLRLTIGWPSSLICPDVLFLIPVPWVRTGLVPRVG